MGTMFNFLTCILIYTTLHEGHDIHILKGWRSLNIHRLIVTLFDLHFNLMHHSIASWSS